MTYDGLISGAKSRSLSVLGGFHPKADDGAPDGCETLILLGPDEPDFWPSFTVQPEYLDGKPNPMDRWSTRVITELAEEFGASPLFPFGGPPYHPFYSWALATGRCHVSPTRLLVHDMSGLFVSFRGALALPQRLDLPAAPPSPCLTCTDQPCQNACPVDAFAAGAYDVPACKTHLASPEGRDCMTAGCLARRACPISQSYGRMAHQSAFHMKVFLGK